MSRQRAYIKVNGQEFPLLCNAVTIGDWEDVKGIPTSQLTKRDEDTALLDGLIIRGYEMEWGKINENRELYTKDAFDKFIQDYFIERGFNLVVDVEHAGHDPQWLAGRVIYAEINSRGMYYIVYVPRTYVHFEMVRNLLQEGILQGFSKMGYATDIDTDYDENGDWYEIVKEFKLLAMSLVSTPANGVQFEKLQEVKRNGLVFRNIETEQKQNKVLDLADL
jgi:phage head maturation protease